MIQIRLIFIILFLFISCQNQEVDKGVFATQAMVVTAHPLASTVGLDILKKGGNAFDAAVAVQFALAVVYPFAGNIAGGGFMVYRKNTGEFGSLDFREKAPKTASRDMYLDSVGNVIENMSTFGQKAVAVPGSVDGMIKIHERFGSLALAELIQPAIDLANKGVALTAFEAMRLNKAREDIISANKFETHLVNPTASWKEGDIILYSDLANTLEEIKNHGRAGFYKNRIADLLIAELERGGSLITQDDLDSYQSKWREAIVGKYKQYKIISMPPPSSGGIALLQLLKGVEPYPIHDWGHLSPQTMHHIIELERRTYADRATHLGDPDFHEVPVEMLLDSIYLLERMQNFNASIKTNSEIIKEGNVEVIESMETTHFSIVDKNRNAVSITTTLNGAFGSKVVVEGGGFLLNNEMDDFSIKPGHPNQFGLVGAEANAIEPEKRMLSSMTPTIVEKDGVLFMVVGTPGGSTIITSVFQTILNVVDHGMTMQEAVNAIKFHSQWLPDKVYIEDKALDSTSIKILMTYGHEIEYRPSIGKMEAILVLPDGSLEGAADYTRGDDMALGY